jgi:hypothetical protein
MLARSRLLRHMVEIGAIGCECQTDRRRKLGKRVGRAAGADAKPADDDGDARPLFLVRRHRARTRIVRKRPRAIGADFGDQTVPGRLQELLIDRRLHRFTGLAGNDDVASLAA